MTLIQRIENVNRLWGMIVPHVPLPPAAWIGKWCVYPDAAVERGIVRASRKFSAERLCNTTVEPALVYQYVCGVARNETAAGATQ